MAIQKTTRDLVIEIHKELKGKTPVSIKELEEATQKSMIAFENFKEYQDEIKKREAKIEEIEDQIKHLSRELTKTRKETLKVRWMVLFPALFILMVIILFLELWQIVN